MVALIAGPQKDPRCAQGMGLPYLAAVLEEAGFEVRIFDRYPPSPDTDDPAVLDERLADAIAREQPAIVGMTVHTPDYVARVRLARLLRERLPHTLLIAGGHHPLSEPEHFIRNTDFDVCVVGEGEETLLEVARQVARGRGGDAKDWLWDIRGLAYDREGRMVFNHPRSPVAELGSLPFPAHHLLGLESYVPHPNTGVVSQGILTYRGCPMGCAFCCNPQGPHVRRRSPSKVVDEMAHVVHGFGVRGFNVYDNLFALHREHALAVCDEIRRRGLEVVWDAWTAGGLVDDEVARRMRAAGCIHVGFGAESGDDKVLARTQRGFTVARHQTGLDALKAAGLRVHAFFLIGLPGESAETVRQTVEFAKRCGADEVCLGIHRPFPGTGVWRDPAAYGVRLVKGPGFEAYMETEHLSRAAILELAEQAGEELKQSGFTAGFLRCDRYAWE
ncbi:MAG: B12-binding domain-containing radical SAM protein [Armatimonadetes bacterium]|nr:B12-binding domain-containing radical SAM protein [Armatimonadota bacterium]